jgi:uncharacterized membrane protein YhhN
MYNQYEEFEMDLKHIFMIALAVVSAVYLVTLFFKQGILQSVLKGCLVPLILAIYIFGAEKILVPVILALIFGWIGDVLLLNIADLRRFRLGLASFLTGHICFIIAFAFFIPHLNVPVLMISIAVAAVFGFCMFKFVRPAKEMKYPVIAYEVIIMLMAISAVQVFFAHGSLSTESGTFGILALTGSILFVISDGTLAFNTFRKDTKIGYFLVMVTYIAAQLLITLGFCAA